MKTLEIVPRGSLLFAMLYNACPSEELGTTYDDEGLPHLLRRYLLDLHCGHVEILAQGVYSDDYPSFGMSPIYYNIVSAFIIDIAGKRIDLTRPLFYEAMTGDWSMSDPHGSIQP